MQLLFLFDWAQHPGTFHLIYNLMINLLMTFSMCNDKLDEGIDVNSIHTRHVVTHCNTDDV